MLRLLVLAGGSFFAAALLYHGLSVALFPYDLNYGEGYVLNDALRLVGGEVPYSDVQEFPMVRSPYPPLFLVLDGLLTRLTGPSFAPGRLISLMSGLAIAALLFVGVFRAWSSQPARPSVSSSPQRRRVGYVAPIGEVESALPTGGATRAEGLFFAAIAAALYLGSPHLYQWIAFSRVDLLANALSLASVVVLLGGVTRCRLVAAAALCALALATKQTAIAAPVAIALYLALRPGSALPQVAGVRASLWFVLWVSFPIGILTAAMAVLSGGEYIGHVLLGNASNPFNLARLVLFQTDFLAVHSVLVATVLTFAVWRLTELPALYAATCFVGTLWVGNEGSSVNYFLEFLAAAILGAGWATSRVGQLKLRPMVRQTAPILAAALQLGLMAHLPNTFGVWVSAFPPHGFTPTPADYEVGERLDALVAGTPGDMLIEPAGFAVRNSRTVWVQPIDLRAEQHRGRWSPDGLVDALERRRFSLIVLSYGFLPLDVLPALERSYVEVDRLMGANGLIYRVLRPRQGSV